MNQILPTVADIPPDTVSLDDVDQLRKRILDRTKQVFSELPPLRYGNYELRIENVDYDNFRPYGISDEMQAILNSRSLTTRLRGDIVLKDLQTGQEQRKRITLLNVPYMTKQGTFIVNGNSYAIVNQTRLRPGIYVRVKDNGMVEALANTLGGRTHHYELDPERNIFYLKFGSTNVPLLSVLRALGVPDEEVIKHWGKEIFDYNAAIAKPNDVIRFMRASNYHEATNKLQEWFGATILDPNVTQLTLNRPFKTITPEVILLATKKMLDVYRQEADPDERDSLTFQQIVGPDDIFVERVKQYYDNLKKYILRAVRKRSLDAIPSSPYDNAIWSLFSGSGLTELLDEINPGEIIDRLHRIIKTGEGGIEDPQRIKDDPRMVHPSHFGFIDPAVTGAQSKVGVDNRFSWLVRRGTDGRIYTLFRDVRNGKFVWRSPNDLANAVITFPGELANNTGPYVRVLHKGQIKYAPREEVDYELPYADQMFTVVSNFVPMIRTIFPQRLMMGQKMHLQALPLENREEPLVQVKYPWEDTSFQRKYATFYGAVYSPVDGKVTRVTNDYIEIQDDSGKKHKLELYNNYPFNRKTFIHNTPVVKPGTEVKKNQLLATSNYTDENGNPAFGINAYVAYVPYRGFSFEDAFVISESFAKKLISQHMYQEQLDLSRGVLTGKNRYRSVFPAKYPAEFYDQYDDDGVIRPGMTVQPGQPLILALQESFNLAGKRKIFNDGSIIWDHDYPGEVVHVNKTKDYYYVAVKMLAPTHVGDKIVGRMGDKGVVGLIVPDDKMPRDKEGRPFDILINPLGIPSRTNIAQAFEAVLGKIAKKRGEPYHVPSDIPNYWEFVKQEAEKYGISPDEEIYDPELNIKIPAVLTGYRYFMKLHHTAESKLQEREFGEYTSEELPAKGGEEGAKRIGILELMGILGHSAYNVVRDAKLIRGQKNDAFWLEFQRGGNPQIDKVPFVFDKFVNMLKGAGINVVNTGEQLHVFALTNDDIKQLTGPRELKNNKTVAIRKDELKEEEGGLFDPYITGGLNGRFWSFFRLAEPMPSPVMEDVFASIMGVTAEKFRDIVIGKETIPGTNLTGPQGLLEYFKDFNVQKTYEQAKAELRSALSANKISDLGRLTKKVRYLEAILKHNQHPSQWFWDRVPVIPPVFRPISVTPYTIVTADINALYQDLMEANDILREQLRFTNDVTDTRKAVYDGLRAVVGIGDPIQIKHKQQGLTGFLGQIAGPIAKFNYVLRKLLSITADITGRAVIVPNPGLQIDQVGLPIEQAWKLYRPFIIRRLVLNGYSLPDALQAYQKQTEEAKRQLLEEIKTRPVIVNRAPVLHRYGVMAFWPVLTKHKVVEFSPFVCATFGADFDGDAVQIHVPVSDAAVREAIERMLPSKNLFSSASFDINYPIKNEFVGGLWVATSQRANKPPVRFKTTKDVIMAYNRGEISHDTPVIVDYPD